MLNSSIFRNYDVRGEYGAELTAEAVNTVARAYAHFSGAKKVVIGSDARISSPELKSAAVQGLTNEGVDVYDIGEVSTDVVYFAAGQGDYDGGIMITASHMPGKYNGMKFLRLSDGVLAPIGKGLGMEELEKMANNLPESSDSETGQVQQIDIWQDYVSFVRGFVDTKKIGPLKVVMDAGNGMGGVVAEKLYKGLNLDITPLYFEPDGNFPNHDPNPILEENRRDIVAKVKGVGANLGVAWDADCDRCYFIDEKGEYVHGDFITTLLAINFLKKNPGAGIVYDLRSTWAVRDWIEKLGGTPHIVRVGHTYAKAKMRETNSILGGELSGHFYFADNKFMDNGFIPSLIIMEMMSKTGKKLSEMVDELGEYHVSGEINFEVDNIDEVIKKIEDKYSSGGEVSRLDGFSVYYDDWHFNVRPSANDPVLRFTAEAKSEEMLREKVAEISAIIEGK